MAGLYIHIPYCVKKCAYCDFTSFPEDGALSAYCDALCSEIAMTAAALPKKRYETVFFGGGTPSLLSGAQLSRILSELRTHFEIAADAEISLECNPGATSREALFAYAAAGVNRLSVGLQSADDGLLSAIGRIHTYAAFQQTVRELRDAGFNNFNVDVMHGLPGQTEAQYLDTIQKAMDSGAKHISAYALILEPGTPLFGAVRRGETVLPEEDETADMEDAGFRLLEENGFCRYEISNFALPGYACRHNLNYWDNGEYVGLGLAAHSAMRLDGKWTRWSNEETQKRYFSAIGAGKRPLLDSMVLPPIEEMFETVMLGLRKTGGVSEREFAARFHIELNEIYAEPIAHLAANGWLSQDAAAEGRLALNARGLDLQNAALQYFLS